MKNYTIASLPVFVLTLLFVFTAASCSIQKRHYRPGFYVHHTGKTKNKINEADKMDTTSHDKLQITAVDQEQMASAKTEVEITDVTPDAETQTASANTYPATPVIISEPPAVQDTVEQQVKPRDSKNPIYPSIKMASIFTGVTYLAYILVAIVLLINGAAFTILDAVVVILGVLLISILLFVSSALVVDGLFQIKKQKEKNWRGKGLGRTLLVLNALPLLLFLILWQIWRNTF